MGKFTTVATYSRFESMWNNNTIDNYSLYFIQDTGQLYAHGVLLNSVAYGTEASGAVSITIAGVTKSLALASHTHSNYIQNNQNIDLQTYKLVSGQNDLIYLSGGNIYVGNTSTPITIQSSTDLKSYRDSHEYTILDTGNFNITNRLSTGVSYNNAALFKYGSSTFQIDYVKRTNAIATFNELSYYTQAGTNQVNNKQYGFMTFYTDGAVNPVWAQLRINITDSTVEYRTSTQSNNWISLSSPQIVQNALDQAGIVAAPSSQTINMVWKTDAQGNPAWREDTAGVDTWRNIRINDETSDGLDTTTSSGALYIKAGNGISVAWDSNSKLVITNSSPNVWQEGSDTQVGYVPQAIKNKFLHCNNTTGALEWIDDNDTWNAVSTLQAGYIPKIETNGSLASSDSPFILVYKNLTGITAPVWVPLPSNAFANDNTWQSNTATQNGYVTAPGANVAGKVWMTGNDGNPSWQDANNHTHSYISSAGFSSSGGPTISTWGTLTAANNYTAVLNIGDSNGGAWEIASKDNQISMQIDGFFYQNEGAYMVLDKSMWITPGNRNNTASKIVTTDSSGYIQAGWINTTSGTYNTSDYTTDRVYCSYDGYIRYLSLADFIALVFSQQSLDATSLSATVAITADTWADTGLSNATTGLTTSGTYAVQVTYSNDIYSGVMSWYAGTGGVAEEIDLHYAGSRDPDTERIYLKTQGGKIYIAANGNSSSKTYTIKIKKLI